MLAAGWPSAVRITPTSRDGGGRVRVLPTLPSRIGSGNVCLASPGAETCTETGSSPLGKKQGSRRRPRRLRPSAARSIRPVSGTRVRPEFEMVRGDANAGQRTAFGAEDRDGLLRRLTQSQPDGWLLPRPDQIDSLNGEGQSGTVRPKRRQASPRQSLTHDLQAELTLVAARGPREGWGRSRARDGKPYASALGTSSSRTHWRRRSSHATRLLESSLKTHRVTSSGRTGRKRLRGTGTYVPSGPSCSIDTDFLRARQNSGTSSAA